MIRSDDIFGLPRDAVSFVPILMLPAMVGGGLLLVAPGSATGQFGLISATVAVAWYMLGGAISLRQLLRGLLARRALARLTPQFLKADHPVWVCDDNGTVLFENPHAATQFGELRGRDIRFLLTRYRADGEDEVRSLRHRAGLKGNANIKLENGRVLGLSLISEAGLQLWTLPAPGQEAAQEPACQAEASPSDEFEDLPVALLRLGSDGVVHRANLAAKRLLGLGVDRQHLGKMLEGPGRAVGDWIADVAAGRNDGRAEMLRLRGDDADRHVQMSLARDPSVRGGLLAVLSDASAIKTLEAQFVQSQKMQAIGQLAGGVAHDFNNLLTAISGHCDLLMLRRDKADPDFADLDQISQNANRAAALVGQLLAFSRKQTLKPTVLNVRDALADLTHLLNRLVGERVTLSISHETNLLPIRADRRQLEQVIMNLVVNARDAMPNGGGIEVRSRNVHLAASLERDRVTLPVGDYVSIEVRDEGTGIAPDVLSKIFEPFFTTKRTGEGTGLGLSTAYGIVKQTGGFIFCDSTLGEGTCFSLYFPAYGGALPGDMPEAMPAAEGLAAEQETQQKATILLVEDEAPVRAFAARALKLKGYDVLEADCAEAALQMLSDPQLVVDVFVTDVVMPGMDGPSWVRSALKERPRTKVIFVSGYTEDVFTEGHAPIPNSIFLPKPFSLSELTETVERHLRGAAAPTLH